MAEVPVRSLRRWTRRLSVAARQTPPLFQRMASEEPRHSGVRAAERSVDAALDTPDQSCYRFLHRWTVAALRQPRPRPADGPGVSPWFRTVAEVPVRSLRRWTRHLSVAARQTPPLFQRMASEQTVIPLSNPISQSVTHWIRWPVPGSKNTTRSRITPIRPPPFGRHAGSSEHRAIKRAPPSFT